MRNLHIAPVDSTNLLRLLALFLNRQHLRFLLDSLIQDTGSLGAPLAIAAVPLIKLSLNRVVQTFF